MPTLNIKDPEVYRLASELAARRGMSMTAVVRAVLEEALAARQAAVETRLTRIEEISRRASAIEGPWLTDDDLYDENGLPR